MIAHTSSNRDNPRFAEYYQSLADLISIFWQFHKARLESGDIAFAYKYDKQTNRHIQFDPTRALQSKDDRSDGYRVVEDFGDSIGETVQASWDQFLELNGIAPKKHFLREVVVPPSLKEKFSHTFIHSLIARANERGCEVSQRKFSHEFFFLKEIVNAGVATGAEVSAQLKAVFQEAFRPALALAVSKISLQSVSKARASIGLTRISWMKPRLQPGYGLLDATGTNFDTRKLKALGFGEVLGCPAGMKPSKETQTFLSERGIDVSKGTMLGEFAEMVSANFDPYLGEWYRGLSEAEKEEFIEEETRRVLEGTWREGGEKPRCPVSPRGESLRRNPLR